MGRLALFLCGDVMTGRGIDQILSHPGEPQLFEHFVKSARGYVELAERKSGSIPSPVDDAYIWGDALAVLDDIRVEARIVNLETAVTASNTPWPGKGIHYRMHPGNIGALAILKPDCCSLANNHVLDWGRPGLLETLNVLQAAGLHCAGAGRNREEAAAPASIGLPEGGRVLVFAWAVASSGVPPEWAATDWSPGVSWLPDLSPAGAAAILAAVDTYRRSGDVVVVSIHWGPNWGYEIPESQRAFARQLVDGGADLVHGHSSHHPLGIEVYRGHLILHGCGDFLNDYEGIGGYQSYRPDLALMYFPILEAPGGRLLELALVPARIRHLRVNLAAEEDSRWLLAMLNREGRRLGTRVEAEGGRLRLYWA